MFSPFMIFILFMGSVRSSLTGYDPFETLKELTDMENNLEPLEMSNRKAIHNNRILDCDMEDIFETVSLNELQDLVEAVASRKGTNPFAILRVLYKRMKSKEEIEENIMNSIDGVPLPDLLSPPLMESLPQARVPPASSHTPYSLPSDDPMNTSDEDDTKVFIIPVADPAPIPNNIPNRFPPLMPPDVQARDKAPFVINNMGPPVNKMNHLFPAVFPILSSVKSNHLRPPLGATIRVNSGDARNPINRDISVTVSPLMTLIEALRQAEIKYQNVLGLDHDIDVITFTHSSNIDCFIVNRINDVVINDDFGWKIATVDRDGQIVYEDFCLPDGEDVLIKPGTIVFLSYVPL